MIILCLTKMRTILETARLILLLSKKEVLDFEEASADKLNTVYIR